jgi:hypothetical protein
MKKIPAICFFVLLGLMFPGSSAYAGTCSVSVSPDSMQVGETATVTMTMTSGTSSGYSDGNITIGNSGSVSIDSIASEGYSTFSSGGNTANFGTSNNGVPEYEFMYAPHEWTLSLTAFEAGSKTITFSIFDQDVNRARTCSVSSFLTVVPTTISACIADIDVTDYPAGSQVGGTIIVANDDATNSVRWIKITRPSSSYMISEIDSSWDVSPSVFISSTDTYTLSGDTLTPGAGASVGIVFTSGSVSTDVEQWRVSVSASTDGSSPTQCTGTLGTSIYGGSTPTPTTAGATPTITRSITATTAPTQAPGNTATPTSATTSVLDTSSPVILLDALPLSLYNKAPKFEGTASDDRGVTEISYSLDNERTWTAIGIVAGKAIHYSFFPRLTGDGLYTLRVRGRDAAGNSVVSDARSFAMDMTPPALTVDTDVSKPLKKSPHFTGLVEDVAGVASVEGSVDGGVNWLQAQPFEKNSKRVFFDIPLPSLDDNNYPIRVRATDGAGNTATSPEKIMVIDRLPPRIGSTVLLLGPHVLEPSGTAGNYELSEHVNVKLVAQAVGGPTEMVLFAASETTRQELKFPFIKNPDSGLWTTTVAMPDNGTYAMSIHAIDGANNTGQAVLGTWDVKDPGKVETESHMPVSGANIGVFVYDTETKEFLPWDAESFGGINPQQTDADGSYNLMLPPGTYYLTVEKNGYQKLRTSIIHVIQPSTVSTLFTLPKGLMVSIGPWNFALPSYLSPFKEVTVPDIGSVHGKGVVPVGSKIPQTIWGEGKQNGPMHVVFMPLFHPQLSSQLQVLETMQVADPSWQTLVILTQASQAEAGVLARQGKYTVPIVSDPDGELTLALGISATPVHYFVGGDGVISGQITGLLLENEIVDNRKSVTHPAKSVQ